MSIKAKQVAGVTTLVVLVVAGMIAVQIASLTRLRIEETASRATTLKESMLHHAGVVVRGAGTTNPYVAIRDDSGMRSILESAVTSLPDNNTILYAAIVDPEGIAIRAQHAVARRAADAAARRPEGHRRRQGD